MYDQIPLYIVIDDNSTIMNLQSIAQSKIQMNECKFFHYAPNYDKFYHITCQTILSGPDSFDDHNYDHGFFYNISPTANYYVICKIFPHSLIANMLNEKIYGIDIGINNLERKELLSLNQRLDLEQDLERILPFHLTQHHISNREIRMKSDRNLNSPYGHNAQTISIADSQTNFDNSFPQQAGVGYYTNNVTSQQQGNFNNIPQLIPKRPGSNGNTNSLCGNIGNNVMTTQAVSITDNQSNGFLQPIDPLSSSISAAAPQNIVTSNVTNSQQQIDFHNISQRITDIEMRLKYYGNINSFHGNIVNNSSVTQPALTTDINQNYGIDSQDVNGAYIRQVDLNNNHRDTNLHNENIGNNVTTMQVNGINDIRQVTQSQQQVDLNNNNVMTTQINGDHQDVNDIHQVTRLQNVDSHHIQHQQ